MSTAGDNDFDDFDDDDVDGDDDEDAIIPTSFYVGSIARTC